MAINASNQYILCIVPTYQKTKSITSMLIALIQALNMLSVHIIAYNVLWFTLGWVIHMLDVVLVYTSTTTSHIMDIRQALKQARRQISPLISYGGAR